MEIKVLEKTAGCFPVELANGEWFDLTLAEDVKHSAPYARTLHKKKTDKDDVERFRDVSFNYTMLPLGVAMEIPKGYEAHIAPRSSTFKHWGILETNGFGIIDNSYKSDKDEWKMPVVATRNITIPKGTRICQFRIQLSQKATMWQKIKWLFSSHVKLVKVLSLNNPERGGFGSTGKSVSDVK